MIQTRQGHSEELYAIFVLGFLKWRVLDAENGRNSGTIRVYSFEAAFSAFSIPMSIEVVSSDSGDARQESINFERSERMIPAIGVMISAYIGFRAIETFTLSSTRYSGQGQQIAACVFAALLFLVNLVCLAQVLTSSSSIPAR